jgi:hypothetical protein
VESKALKLAISHSLNSDVNSYFPEGNKIDSSKN